MKTDKLEKQVKTILKAVNNNVEKCVDILKEESPKLCKEILSWEGVISFIPFILAVIGMALFTTYAFLIKGWWYFLLVGSGICFFICCVRMIWLKALIAPRLFLIEYIKKFIPKKEPDYN